MPKTCSTCRHWHALTSSRARSDGPLGECREASPTRDLAWPRTRCTDFCSRYASAAASAAPEAAAQEPRAAVPAEPLQFSLVVAEAAPTPAPRKTPADAHGSTRQRAAKTATKTVSPWPRPTGPGGDE